MRALFRGVWVCLLISMPITEGLAQASLSDDTEALRRLNLYRADIANVLPSGHRNLALSITLRAPKAGGLSGVGAGRLPDGTRVIAINQGTQYAVQQLAQAVVLGQYVLRDMNFVAGYVRYLAYWGVFGPSPLTAVQFAKYYGVSDAEERLNDLSQAEQSIGDGVEALIMLFITAHEIAHHVLGDVDRGLQMPEVQRSQEARADAWAADRIFDLGLSPEVVVLSMALIDQTEQDADPDLVSFSRHPKALERAKTLLGAVLSRLEDAPEKASRYLSNSPTPVSLEEYKASLQRSHLAFGRQIEEAKLWDEDATALIASAKKGNPRAQLRLAMLHQTGDRKGIEQNASKAQAWAELAGMNKTKYEYFTRAYAYYTAGKLASNKRTEDEVACHYMQASAKMQLQIAILQLQRFQKDGICPK